MELLVSAQERAAHLSERNETTKLVPYSAQQRELAVMVLSRTSTNVKKIL
jgi:hypothetical protein